MEKPKDEKEQEEEEEKDEEKMYFSILLLISLVAVVIAAPIPAESLSSYIDEFSELLQSTYDFTSAQAKSLTEIWKSFGKVATDLDGIVSLAE